MTCRLVVHSSELRVRAHVCWGSECVQSNVFSRAVEVVIVSRRISSLPNGRERERDEENGQQILCTPSFFLSTLLDFDAEKKAQGERREEKKKKKRNPETAWMHQWTHIIRLLTTEGYSLFLSRSYATLLSLSLSLVQ